jgi:hypothetical protein
MLLSWAIAIPVRLRVKTGGNIAPANRRNSRRFQPDGCSERSILSGAGRATRTIFCPSRMGMRASPISERSPSPIKCQMKIAETANFGMTRSQSPRDILAAMTAINPTIIAIIKIETRTRPKA